MTTTQTRRSFLAGLSALGVSATLPSSAAGSEGDLETTSVRFIDFGGAGCTVPQFVAEELLHAEGFSDVQYVYMGVNQSTISMMAKDEVDFSLDYASVLAKAIDQGGVRMKALSGIHVGCYMLFGQEGIKSVLDLKGRKVGVGPALGTDPHVFIGAMATYVGLDPVNDINWVVSETTPLQLFLDGKIDAMLAFAAEAQEMLAKKIGQVVVNSLEDPPWSHYFCCLTLASASFVEKCPVATKRVVRALVKAADICAAEPDRVVRMMLDKGYEKPEKSDYVLQSVRQIPYAAWRDLDPEDTIRFFALRLHEAGMVKSSPQKIIEEGTDWSFITQVKRELKA